MKSIRYYYPFFLTLLLLIIYCGRDNVFDPSPETLNDGLAAFYPFNGNAQDESGHNLNGNVRGAILTEDRNNNAEKAYYFDGIDDYIQVENKQIINLTNSLSISVWAKGSSWGPDNGQSITGIVAKGPVVPFGLGIDDGDRLLFRIVYQDNYYEALKTGAGINTTKWNHYVGVFNAGNSIRLYVNGKLIVQNKSSIPQKLDSSDLDLWIGARAHSQKTHNIPLFFFKGSIDEVRVYNRALKDEEIHALYNLKD